MRAAAALLSAATSLPTLEEVWRAAGLASDSASLDPAELIALGLDGLADARLAAGPGSIRTVLLRVRESALRDALPRIASRLSSRAPHVLWFLAALDERGEMAALVGWSTGTRTPRLASFVWEPGRVADSDAETLCALSALLRDDDVAFHGRCVEVLGRDALTRRFYRVLETQVAALGECLAPPVSRNDARAIALLYTSRLLFLCFLEAKGWLNGERGFLGSRFDECMRAGGGFHHQVLLPLFFGTLNTPYHRRAKAARAFGRIPFLNGGLFTRTPLERRAGRRVFPDERMGALLSELFQRFRFVAREDSTTWSEAAIDPEMLGRAFESLMAAGDRKAGGVFYTPHRLVNRVGEEAMMAALASRHPGLEAIREVRVLDPACGSGAFLVFVLERLADRRRALGDTDSLATIRRDTLARSIFGVDRDPTAVWLCELRLWLSVVIESDETDPRRIPPLPNLDRNIRVGDSLTGASFVKAPFAIEGGRRMVQLRARYVRATGPRKQSLAKALDREERRRTIAFLERSIRVAQHARREHLAAVRARDLFGQRVRRGADAMRETKRLRDALRAARRTLCRLREGSALPFSFSAFFAEAQAAGGFDIVVGNPPWVRLHRIPVGLRVLLKQIYEVYRGAPWSAGAAAARAAPGFASQVDLAALFVERAVALLRPSGVVAFLLPVKLWHSLAGGGVRRFLMERTSVLRLEDLSESGRAFDAAAYPSLLVARVEEPRRSLIAVAVHGRSGFHEWQVSPASLAFDHTPGAPWLLLAPDARAAFDRVRDAGIPLACSPFGAPRLGVKSGCNSAFVVRVEDTAREIAWVVDSDGERGKIELALLRPALRGDALAPWTRARCSDWIIWTHDDAGPLRALPAHARHWLQRRYGALAARADATRSRRWWSLFRTEAADSRLPRLVWADFGRRPRALVLSAGDPAVPLNTCYVLRCRDECDAWALAGIMNSPLAAAWLNTIAEPARGGYRRYLGWTMGLLPLPRDWNRWRAMLAACARDARDAAAGDSTDLRLHDGVLSAYGFDRGDVAALLDQS